MFSNTKTILDTTPTARGQVLTRDISYQQPSLRHRFSVWPLSILSATTTFSFLIGIMWYEKSQSYRIVKERADQYHQEIRQEKDKRTHLEEQLNAALHTPPPGCVLTAPTPTEPPEPLFRSHVLHENETLLGLGYKFCRVKPGNQISEQNFLDALVTLNHDGILWNGEKRTVTKRSLNVVHAGERWLFPPICKIRLDPNH